MVVSALDRQTGARVAIKKCPNVFEDPLDAKRIAREIRLLRHFHHPNIIKVSDLWVCVIYLNGRRHSPTGL